MASIAETATIRVGREEFSSIKDAQVTIAARLIKLGWDRVLTALRSLGSMLAQIGEAAAVACKAIATAFEPVGRRSDYALWPGSTPINQMRPIGNVAPRGVLPH